MLVVKICLVSIHLKREFKCDWVIENNIVMTFALFNQFNQSEEKNWQEKKKKITQKFFKLNNARDN